MKIANTKKITAYTDRYNALAQILSLKPYKLRFATVLQEYAHLADAGLFTDQERKATKNAIRQVMVNLQKKRATELAKM